MATLDPEQKITRINRWQWTGVFVGIIAGAFQASYPWQGEGLLWNLVGMAIGAITGGLLARAVRQWLDARA